MRRRYYIQDRVNGERKAAVESLEFHDEWMGESYVTIDAKSSEPIAFGVDDYIEYRGERFVIEGDASTLKQARRGSYGSGFEYKNMKLMSEALSKFVRCDFTDLVLGPDNQMHYTGLPTFPFYCETVDDLLDRIQACLEELFPGEFVLLGRNTVRNRQRGQAVGREQGFIAAYRQWVDSNYQPGQETTDTYGKTGVAETVDNIGCWDALAKVNEDFDLTFIRRGYVFIVGAEGMPTRYTYRYGKGNGLKTIERIGDTEEKVVTRLKSYGNETNIPRRYYARVNANYFLTVDKLATLDGKNYWSMEHQMCAPSIMFREKVYTTYGSWTARTSILVDGSYVDAEIMYDALNYEKLLMSVDTLSSFKSGDRVYFSANIDKDKWPSGNVDYAADSLPNNMAVSRLMLPGFPDKSLDEWVRENRPELIDEGFSFSTDAHRPYIDSPKTAVYGVRPGNLFFDGSDDRDDIYPTLEGMVYPFAGGSAVDIILSATDIQDDGVLPDEPKETDKRVEVVIPYGGFPLDELWEQGAKIELKSGPCCARSLEIQSRPKRNGNTWVCQCSRAYDDLLDLWFPYNDYPIIRNGETTKFVLTGIDLPEAYVEAASVRLFDASIAALRKIDTPKNTWKPTIDEVWMAKEEDDALANGRVSQHDALTAGDIFMFEDEDLGVEAGIIIDTLTIREWGNNGIATYEIALRDEKQASSISRLIGKVESVGKTDGRSTPAQTAGMVYTEGSKYFLSKEDDDEAHGLIGFVKGLWVKAKGLFGFDENGNVKANDAEIGGVLTALKTIINSAESTNYTSGELTGTGWKITNDNGSGLSRLEVDEIVARSRFIANVLEARKYVALGGNYVYSPAASVTERVDYINRVEGESVEGVAVEYAGAGAYEYHYQIPMVAGQTITLSGNTTTLPKYIRRNSGIVAQGEDNEITYTANEDCNVYIGCFGDGHSTLSYVLNTVEKMLGYEELRMPWHLRGIPLWIATKLMAKKKLTFTNVSDSDKENATVFRCWIKADDGTTKTINTWREGMLARCQTMDINESPEGTTHTEDFYDGHVTAQGNKMYWRAVVGTGNGLLPISDGLYHSYVDLSNESGKYLSGSDLPSAGDSIVCYGDYLHEDTSNIIVIETVGDDAPAIKEFKGVGYRDGETITSSNFDIEGKLMTRISPKRGNLFIAPEFKVVINGSERDLATFIINTDGMISEVRRVQANGKNLLTGVLTGDGWKSGIIDNNTPVVESDIVMDGEWFKHRDEDAIIISPVITISERGFYTLSFEVEGTQSVQVGLWKIGTALHTSTVSVSDKFSTYTEVASGDYRVVVGCNGIRHPQVESGKEATTFDAGTTEVSSLIKQTADSIEFSITDELGKTGIDIGEHEINMSADKFTLKNLKGDDVLSADSQGNLGVSGTIVAKNLYRGLCVAYPFDSQASDDQARYYNKEGEDWRYIKENVALLEYIEDTFPSHPEYADFFALGSYVEITSLPSELAEDGYIETYIGLIRNTAYADLVIICNNGQFIFGDYDGGHAKVRIPRAQDFAGKTLEIKNMAHQQSGASIDIDIYQADEGNVFVYSPVFNGSTQANPHPSVTIAYEEDVRLFSDGTYWLVL